MSYIASHKITLRRFTYMTYIAFIQLHTFYMYDNTFHPCTWYTDYIKTTHMASWEVNPMKITRP